MGIVSDLSAVIICALIGGLAAASLRLPLLLGYICAGVFLSPHTGIYSFSALKDIELLSEFGVALLLFALGLEFSLEQLKSVRRIALIGTPIQVLLTAVLGYGIGIALGWEHGNSVAFGIFISLSSTTVVLKNLTNLGLLSTLSAKVMVGMLIVQDLIVIPFMVLLPQLGQENIDFGMLVWSIVKAGLIVTVAISFGRKLLPRFMEKIATRNSRELYLIALTGVAIGVSSIGHLLGFSFAFGAFIAGIALSESDHQHRALADITPIRDLFVLVFFVTVGILINPSYIVQNALQILTVLLVIMAGKGLILYILARSFHYANVVPLAVALGLSQMGEFSLVLGQIAIQANTVSQEVHDLTISVAVVSMLCAPFMARLVHPLYQWHRGRSESLNLRQIEIPQTTLFGHVVVVGGGRVGKYVAKTLRRQSHQFVIIEENYELVRALKEQDLPVLFGDASHPLVLEAVQLDQARLIVIAIANKRAVTEILEFLRQHDLVVPIIARAHSREDMIELHAAGINHVVEPFFEGGLEMATQALATLGMDPGEVQTLSDELRADAYRGLDRPVSLKPFSATTQLAVGLGDIPHE